MDSDKSNNAAAAAASTAPTNTNANTNTVETKTSEMASKPVVCLLVGMAGAGKTSLMQVSMLTIPNNDEDDRSDCSVYLGFVEDQHVRSYGEDSELYRQYGPGGDACAVRSKH